MTTCPGNDVEITIGMATSTKLYRVELRGVTRDYNVSYVVAQNPDVAYQMVRRRLEKDDMMTDRDRELRRVELIAELADYPACGTRLYVEGEDDQD